jgi:uncharacterized surface protein with fasciclin (FAS1) repeats
MKNNFAKGVVAILALGMLVLTTVSIGTVQAKDWHQYGAIEDMGMEKNVEVGNEQMGHQMMGHDSIYMLDLSEYQTVAGYVTTDKAFTTLTSLLVATGLDAAVSAGEYTVFAPENDAFERFLAVVAEKGITLTDAQIKATLLNHVVAGNLNLAEIEDGTHLTTLGGLVLTVDKREDMMYLRGTNGEVAGSWFGNQTSTGSVYAINTVLSPIMN